MSASSSQTGFVPLSMTPPDAADDRHEPASPGEIVPEKLPFRLTRFLAWVSLVLILASSLFLAFFIGNFARETLLVRQQDYSLLLGGNLNHQIARRFVVPTMLAFGRIALRQPLQYRLLDEVVQDTIKGLQIDTLRIYGTDKVVNYSLDRSELGRGDMTPSSMTQALDTGKPVFETLSSMSLLKAMFMLDMADRAFLLRMSFPLSVQLPGEPEEEGESLIVGVVEVTKDITGDYETVIRFQWVILALCLGSSVVLFCLLQMFIVRAERILSERMARTRRLEAELHENERLVSMGRVIASIAHEIRNPLGIIRSSAELLLRRSSELDDANRRLLGAMYDESRRLSQTVNDFLDYARPRVPRQDLVDLNQVVDQVLGFLEGELRRSETAVSRQTPEVMVVHGDKDLLYRAIYNVVSNALQAMGSGGTLHILGRRLGEGQLELSFRDSGPGFDPAGLEHALDPFFTTKDHGTGLGLPIVNTIITGHGGQLHISNAPAPESGAVIAMILPLARDAS